MINNIKQLGILIFVFSSCVSNSERAQYEEKCENKNDGPIEIYIGRIFDNDKVVVKLNNKFFYENIVSTDPAIEIAAVLIVNEIGIREISFVLNDSDSIIVCSSPFIILNREDQVFRVERLDSIPKFRFL